jgi:adenylate cyclase
MVATSLFTSAPSTKIFQTRWIFKDKIVIVGESSIASKEIMKTPFGMMPGMQIHANIAATLLSTRGAPRPLSPLLVATLSLLASLLLLLPLLRYPLWTSFVMALFVGSGVLLFGAFVFVRFHRVVPLSVPALALVLTLNGLALYEYWRARATLGAFIGTDMLPQAMNLLTQLRLGGKTEEATAWFCDLRGYSSLTESLPSEVVSQLLGEYTQALVQVVRRHGGRPIDYQGDGVFVLFEKNRSGRDHAVRAVRAALETEDVFSELRRKWSEKGARATQIGIGIATGTMMIGVVGASEHMKMGAVGDAVNVAARVQSLSRTCGHSILLASSTYERVEDVFPAVHCGAFMLHGRKEPLEVYGLSALSEDACEKDVVHDMDNTLPNDKSQSQYTL